jgi:hypothetical protein
MDPIQIKGTTVRDTLETLRGRMGEVGYDHLLTRLDEPSQRLLREPIIASQWYPLDAFTTLLVAVVNEHDHGDPKALAKRAERVFEKQLTGIYRIFIRLGSPEALIKRIAATHATYFHGPTTVEIVCEQHKAFLRCTGFAAQHWIIDYAIQGFYRKGLELSGASEPKVEIVTATSEGKGYSEFALSWS